MGDDFTHDDIVGGRKNEAEVSDEGSLNENTDDKIEREGEQNGEEKSVGSQKSTSSEDEDETDADGDKNQNIRNKADTTRSFRDLVPEDHLRPDPKPSTTESETSARGKEDVSSLGSDINICISDSKLQDLKERPSIKKKLQKMFGVQTKMTQKEFDNKIRILYKCCLKSVRDLHELHLRRMMGFPFLVNLYIKIGCIKQLLEKAGLGKLSSSGLCFIISGLIGLMGLSIIYFILKMSTISLLEEYLKKAEECMKSYSQLIRLFRPEMHRIILNAIITFYREGKLWEIEFACTDLIVQLLQIYQDAEEGIEDLLYTLETSTLLNVHEAKCLTQILYEILKKVRWKRMSEYLMKKILYMLESSIVPKSTDNYNYLPLRKGLEICMRNTIGNLGTKDLMKLLLFILKKMREKDLDEETIMCFGNLGSYAAKKFRMRTPNSSVLEGPLQYIFRLFQINNPVLILYAMRMWQSLIDRNNNAFKFLSPRIFLRDCNYGLTMTRCQDGDKTFFKSMRHLVYQISLNTFINTPSRLGFENMYQAIALTLIEIPCGYTASCFITVAMSLQEYAFSITQEHLVTSHHLHATILSLLTLVCYIHNATVFYDYVNTIMERRAEWAPHLNPPLKAHYEYAQHHVLWNKPELFFEDWEARYGLWKCFRTKRKDIPHKSIIV